MGPLRKTIGTVGTFETIGTSWIGGTPGTIGTPATLELLELLERSTALRSRSDVKNHSVHKRRRISQRKNLPAQLVVGDLPGDAGKFVAFDGYFDCRVFDHVLAPVLALYFARGRIITAAVINQA